MELDCGFDAVIFDLDGTLVATDRFWIEAAECGAGRAFSQLGLERPLPTHGQWLGLVGTRIEEGFRELFPDLSEEQRRVVLAACIEEEEGMLSRDGVPAMPDARAVIEQLRAQGVAVAIASNCQQSYLERMLDALDLRSLVHAAYCAETPGMTTKGHMLAHLLRELGTRSAVMVGDRESDRDAAWGNGIPHVHCAFGFAQGHEDVEAEGRIGALSELLPLLARRPAWIDAMLGRLDALRPGVRVGVGGAPLAGKTLLARDAARRVEAHGIPALALSLEDYTVAGPDSALDHERLWGELLQPHASGVAFELPTPDLLGRTRIPGGAVLFLEGDRIHSLPAEAGFERRVSLQASAAVLERRRRANERWGLPGGRAPRSGQPAVAHPCLPVPLEITLEASNALGEGPDAAPEAAPSLVAGLGAARPAR